MPIPSLKQVTKKIRAGQPQGKVFAELRRAIAIAEADAALHQVQASTRLIAIARDLLPQAASYARKGRPRLLAVLAKIIAEPKSKKADTAKETSPLNYKLTRQQKPN